VPVVPALLLMKDTRLLANEDVEKDPGSPDIEKAEGLFVKELYWTVQVEEVEQ